MLPSSLPDDCTRIIVAWYWDFQIAEAVERIRTFRSAYESTWSTSMDLIRELTPMYRIVWINEHYPSPMTVFLPDCRSPFSLHGATIERRVPFFRRQPPPLNLND